MTVLFKKRQVTLQCLDEAGRSCGEKLRRHPVNVAERYPMREVLAKIVVERGRAVPASREVFSPGIAVPRGCQRAPDVRADHRTGDEFVDVSAGQKTSGTRIGSRELQRRVALEPG